MLTFEIQKSKIPFDLTFQFVQELLQCLPHKCPISLGDNAVQAEVKRGVQEHQLLTETHIQNSFWVVLSIDVKQKTCRSLWSNTEEEHEDDGEKHGVGSHRSVVVSLLLDESVGKLCFLVSPGIFIDDTTESEYDSRVHVKQADDRKDIKSDERDVVHGTVVELKEEDRKNALKDAHFQFSSSGSHGYYRDKQLVIAVLSTLPVVFCLLRNHSCVC